MRPVGLRLLLMAVLTLVQSQNEPTWRCPELSQPDVSCTCDLPHTLRCVADHASLAAVARRLRNLPESSAISLLDVTAQNLTTLPSGVLAGVSLHGLVISSGQISSMSPTAFVGLSSPLQALGLPSNALTEVPTAALQELNFLDRLDLSHNKLVNLNASSFGDISNLTFLDLSDNSILNVSFDTFKPLNQLEVLRLRGNFLSAITVSKLQYLDSLTELDLSANDLVGPLTPSSLASMPSLETLLLADNQLSSVRLGMLRGCKNLLTLNLNHNLIDVLEDHAFLELPLLRTLDLGSNRIVAVSGASLAHLAHLTELDLAHNFLRALTADLVLPLASLRELRVDDNDISMVASDALTERTSLQRLTIADNPLNCDCMLISFAAWLNNSSLAAADRRTAVCATPPALENALLTDIAAAELRCGDDLEHSAAARVPLSDAQVTLRVFRFDGSSVTLLWSVESGAAPFTCDAVFIYEEVEEREILLSSNPLRCNSSQLADPTALTVRLPAEEMEPGHLYRYCVVLLESKPHSDEVQLVLGCSEVIALTVTTQSVAQPPRTAPPARIAGVNANLTDDALSISVAFWDAQPDPHCRVTITVLAAASLAAQHHVNCSSPKLVVSGLPPGPYHVCATLGAHPPAEPRVTCVPVPVATKPAPSITLVAGFLLAVSVLGLLMCFAIRRLRRPRIVTTHQCFLATETGEEGQHARYVKLHATTKL